MGYISMGAYSATLRIPEFKGLMQYGDGMGQDPRYALESVNAQTREGILRPMAGCELLKHTLPQPIETLAMLHRRWYTTDDARDVLIAGCGGKLYWAPAGAGQPGDSGAQGGEGSAQSGAAPKYEGLAARAAEGGTCVSTESWTEIGMPESVAGYQNNNWSWVTYEINPAGGESPVDVMLLSNAYDGMVCIRGDDMTASVVPTPKKFGVIARYAERIWGGAIIDDPDMLVYSAPYDPFDWTQNDEIPEDGAGDVMQPSWDGDSFTTLTPFGSQLLAFKRTRVWRILGTNPGEYTFKEQYGGGASYAATVATDGTRILMLSREGLRQYDGESVAAYYQEYAEGVFRRMTRSALDKAFAVMHNGTYYCALPLDGAASNNAVLIYNTREHTWLLREDVEVEAFLSTEGALYFTSAATPGRLWRWHDDAWDEGAAQPMRWMSPWMDFGYKNVVKGSFTLYLTVECRAAVTLRLSIQTEKKTKSKAVVFTPPQANQNAKQRRISFGGNGRRYRLIIESTDETPWRMTGGVQMEIETDTD